MIKLTRGREAEEFVAKWQQDCGKGGGSNHEDREDHEEVMGCLAHRIWDVQWHLGVGQETP